MKLALIVFSLLVAYLIFQFGHFLIILNAKIIFGLIVVIVVYLVLKFR